MAGAANLISAVEPTAPLLTVAIPTWNRAGYLADNLAQLRSELKDVATGLVELIVSDNCSPDATPAVVAAAVDAGMPIRYVRNEKNVGWALNFVQCFDLAQGKYVLLLGDDDLFVDGALAALLKRLHGRDYGVVCLRPYGYDADFRREYPGAWGRERAFSDANRFLVAISPCFTLTSACVLNKSLLRQVDSRQFVSTNLATFHLLLRAALAANENLFVEKYTIASKRQNSASYDFADVFLDEFWRIVDAQVQHGLSPRAVRAIERRRLLSYYPFYLFDLRLSARGDLKPTLERFAARFGGRWLFWCWLAPILWLPRSLALLWGAVATFVGRVAAGDLRRGLKFGWARLVRSLEAKRGHAARIA